jgi:proteasome lid subunit RPN8/RPN11
LNGPRLHLPQKLRDEIIEAARLAFPLECCGLIEGASEGGAWQVHAVHAAKNLAEDPASNFLIDPQTHFDLLRRLRGSDRRIIGCFHSHPNGRPEPSSNDCSNAIENDFVWLIASGDSVESFRLAAFVFSEKGGNFVELDLRPRGPGAE